MNRADAERQDKTENIVRAIRTKPGTTSLSAKLLRNIVASYAAMFVIMLSGLLLTPFVLRHLGDTLYGIWALVGSIMSYFGLLDLGMSTSVAKYVAQYSAQGRAEKVNSIVSTLFYAYCALAVAALAVILGLTFLFPSVFEIPMGYESVSQLAFFISGLNFMIMLPASILNAVLVGYQRIDLNSVAGIIATAINALLTVVLLSAGFGLVTLALIAVFTTLLLAAARLRAIRRTSNSFSIQAKLFDTTVFPEIMTFSLVVFGLQVMYLIAFGMDNVIIGLFMPVAAITPYAIAYKLVNFMRNLTMPFMQPFFPAFAELNAREEHERLQRVLVEGTRIATALALPMAVLLLIKGRTVLSLWVGPDYVSSTVLVSILTLALLSNVIRETGSKMLIGMGVVKRFFYAESVRSLSNVAFSIALVKPFGLIGIALGTLIPEVLVDWLFILPHVCRVTNIHTIHLLRKAIMPPMLSLGPATLLLLLLHTRQQASFGALMTESSIFLACYVIIFYRFGLDISERRRYQAKLKCLFTTSADGTPNSNCGQR